MSTTDSTVSVVHDPARRRKNSKEFNPPMMRIILLGKDVSTNSRVGNLMLGRSAFDSEAPPDDHQIERVRGKDMMIINCPHLLQLNLLYHQIIQTVRECVDLSHPGPHVIILIFKHDECSREDQERLEIILNSFSDSVYQHTLVLTTHDDQQTEVNDIIKEIIKRCLNKHYRLEKNNSPDELIEKFKNIVKSNNGHYLIDNEYKELQFHTMKQQTDEREGVKLNLVLCGSDRRLKISISKLMMKESSRRSVMRSDYMRREMEVCGRLINLMELPALTRLSEDKVMRQTLQCLSLCDPGVHVFLLIIPDDPLTDEDKAEMKKIHKIFSSRIKNHIMVLIMHKSEDTTAELNEATQSDIKHYAGQCHVFSPNTQVSTLIERVEQMVEDNRGAYFSIQTFLDEQMKKKSPLRETQTESHDRPEMRDDVRIVLLGKTGVGKSATGNTILNRQAFISEQSFESVTSECQKQTAEINNRWITVIDTPGLFDTERSHEEIKREMMNCISMILPGPHVFLLLVSLGRFTQEESRSVKIIQEMFGENSLMFTMVLFTRGDQLRNKTIEECLGKPGSGIRNLIEECGNRYHVFNNNLTEDQTQVSLLLEKIDDMVKANGDGYYSSKIFREMEREKYEQQMKKLMERIEELSREKDEERERMKMMMEEERQSNERERKKREEEFREKEERDKREVKEKEEQERQMRDEMRKEREEHERQKREENEKMREREREMWSEYKQRLKQEREETQRENEKIRQEKEKIEREKEDLKLRHEGEIKRLTKQTEEEKLNQDKEKKKREEEYKTEIKEKDEYLKEMRDEMKRAREECERERKTREEDFKEKEEQERQKEKKREEEYKTEIKQKDEHAREMRDEMRRDKNETEELKKKNKDLLIKHEKLMNTIENERQNHERERKRNEDVFREREEQYKREIERLTKHTEEEKLNQDSEKKRREEEFRQKEEEYKTEIKEKDKHVREMRDEMRREREENEKQRQEERQRREEDGKEKQIYVEQCERLKSEMNEIMKEKERIEREKEDLQLRHEGEIKRLTKQTEEEKLNQDKEKKKREEEFRQREEEYKTEIKEKDEYLREVRDEMRKEREIFKNDAEELKKENKNLLMKYETQTDKLMNTIENHEKERKRGEDEFREKEEKYNREIKGKEQQERQMRDEMRRERKEHERQRQEEKQRREEDEKEKQIYVEQCEKLKSEMNETKKVKERIEREKEDQLEEFEKRIQEERNMREEQEKRYEDKLKLMKEENEDELKRKTTEMIEKHEREKEDQLEEFEKRIKEERNMREEQEKRYEDKLKQQMYVRAQEKRVKDETKEKYEEKLNEMMRKNKELQLKINLYGIEEEKEDLKHLRIVLIGKAGSGKSATGNTILGREQFESSLSPVSVTRVCERGVCEVNGRSIAVVDTPGLFDTTLSNKQIQEEMMKCVSLSSPGPHAFIIVLRASCRITREESETIDLIKKMFGPKVAQFSIILFTRGDDLEGKSIEDYVKRIYSAELQKLIRDCGDRYLAFNNRETQDRTQVIKLIKMIEEMKTTNHGQYFTNSMSDNLYECVIN